MIPVARSVQPGLVMVVALCSGLAAAAAMVALHETDDTAGTHCRIRSMRHIPRGPVLHGLARSAVAGTTLTVYWTAPASHSSLDWLGLYAVGADDQSYLTWAYVPPGSSGAVQLQIPDTAHGRHELRYYRNNGYELAAASSPIHIRPAPPVCRSLREGDPWYSRWTACCDSPDRTRSYWTAEAKSGSGWYDGSCTSWGIAP